MNKKPKEKRFTQRSKSPYEPTSYTERNELLKQISSKNIP